MLFVIVLLIFRPWRNLKPLLHGIAIVLYYLAMSEKSRMETGLAEAMRGLAMLGTRERVQKVVEIGRLYAIGIVEGDRLMIDDDRRIVIYNLARHLHDRGSIHISIYTLFIDDMPIDMVGINHVISETK
jgi:hypothetical protein